jgi:hypothetical protein
VTYSVDLIGTKFVQGSQIYIWDRATSVSIGYTIDLYQCRLQFCNQGVILFIYLYFCYNVNLGSTKREGEIQSRS